MKKKIKASGETPIRAIRMPDELWEMLTALAQKDEREVSDYVRKVLRKHCADQLKK